jgi:hypothetical protein
MTVSSTTVRNEYTATGGQTVFAIGPIDYNDDSEILVYKNNVLLAEGPDYSIDTLNVTLTSGATNGDSVDLVRSTPRTQTKDIQDGDPIPVEVLEEGLDRVVRILQEVAEEVDAATTYPLPTPAANKLLGWNAGATALENKDQVDISALEADIANLEAKDASLDLDIAALQAQDLIHTADIVTAQAAADSAISTNVTQAGLINANTLGLVTVNQTLVNHSDRLDALESYFGGAGSQILINNVLAPQSIIDLVFDGTAFDTIVIEYSVIRSGSNGLVDVVKASSGKLPLLYCKTSGLTGWKFDVGVEVVDPSGLTFSLVQTGINNKDVQVQYISDDSVTENNIAKSNYIKYRIVKFGV